MDPIITITIFHPTYSTCFTAVNISDKPEFTVKQSIMVDLSLVVLNVRLLSSLGQINRSTHRVLLIINIFRDYIFFFICEKVRAKICENTKY